MSMRLPRLSLAAALLCIAAALPARAQTPEPPSTRVLTRESVLARFADADSRFIEVDGVKLHYKDQGSGPALLLVHGTMGDLGDWDGWTALLSRRYRVIRFDIPGFGLSGPIASGNYSTDRIGSLIDGFMDQLGAERFAIAGISYGGLITFRYAATRTDRITALILANSAGIETGRPAAPATPSSAASAAAATANIFFSEVITAADVEGNLRHMLADHSLVRPQLVQRKLAFINTVGRGEESRVSRRQYERGDPLRVLAHVKAPALVLWGGANKALSTQTSEAFANAMKNACFVERKVFPEAGHMLIIDKAQQTVGDAQSFLDRVTAGAACRTAADKR
ncbi:alpha/beta fold hydrolase [Roseateles sp. LKC17W]|uniref:Alpha/beta fold hydrolase n=1 Tax=Pelomonas margarita TaxID=3299031 RepID=A0ABW7FJN3_9BURK